MARDHAYYSTRVDLRDTPDEVAFRADARAWIEANLSDEVRGGARSEQPLREWSRKL